MNLRRLRIKRTLIVFSSLILVATGYTNCSSANFKSKTPSRTQNSGDYYTGKTTFYSHFDNKKCSVLGRDGKPLPNRQIFLQNGVFNLVRDNCSDLVTPLAIPLSDLTVSADESTVTYQGESFALDTNFVNYDVMNTRCPAGLNTYNTAAPNLMTDVYNFSTPAWTTFHPPIKPVLDGAIGALPRYLIGVTSNNPADWFDWQRAGQGVYLEPNTQYALRFILRPGSKTAASIQHYYDPNDAWAVSVDLLSNGLSVRQFAGNQPTGINEPYIYGSPGSRMVTIFFTTGPSTTGSDIGVAPLGLGAQGAVQPGDSIYATAADLRKVSDYCSP